VPCFSDGMSLGSGHEPANSTSHKTKAKYAVVPHAMVLRSVDSGLRKCSYRHHLSSAHGMKPKRKAEANGTLALLLTHRSLRNSSFIEDRPPSDFTRDSHLHSTPLLISSLPSLRRSCRSPDELCHGQDVCKGYMA
jgi:hypothetical protein